MSRFSCLIGLRVVTVICVFTIFAVTSPVEAITSSPASSSTWLRIMHMEQDGGGQWKSRVENSSFFFSPNGRSDPEAEWNAAVRKFNDPYHGPADLNPQCLFPRRAKVVRDLGVNTQAIPNCPALTAFKNRLGAKSVTVVHAAQYMEDPASIFGHIFLRLDVEPPSKQQFRLDTMAYSIGYFAIIPPDVTSFAYITKGLAGGFSGNFVTEPYSRSLRSYNHLEDREIREYELSLSDAELSNLLDHLWELDKHARFSYRFLRENCAFQILAILEATTDRINLIKHFDLYTIPSDAIRMIEESGLVTSYMSRASLGERLRTQLSLLDTSGREQVWSIVADKLQPALVNDPEVLDASYDALEYRTFKLQDRSLTELTNLQKQVLARRASLPARTTYTPERPSPTVPPIQGPIRTSIGLSWASSSLSGILVGFRPAMQNNIELNAASSGLELEIFLPSISSA